MRLRQLFGRYATYTGCSPFLAPATLMLIAHVEQSGVWLVQGGMVRLAQAMRQLLESDGLDKMRVDRVTGFADRRPASQHPMAVRNNRLELILLRNGK